MPLDPLCETDDATALGPLNVLSGRASAILITSESLWACATPHDPTNKIMNSDRAGFECLRMVLWLRFRCADECTVSTILTDPNPFVTHGGSTDYFSTFACMS